MADFSSQALRAYVASAMDADHSAYPGVDAGPADGKRSNKGLWLSLAALGAGQGLDAASTVQALHSGAGHESNPVYGSNPSTARILATKAAIGIPLALLAAKLHDSHPVAANLIGSLAGAAGSLAAMHNYGVIAKQKGQ